MNNIIHEALSEIMRQEIEFGEGVLVSIGTIDCASDLGRAKVWLDIWPEGAGGKVLTILDKQQGLIRKELARRIEMRRVPKILFIIDKDEIEDERQRNKVEEILMKIKKEENER